MSEEQGVARTLTNWRSHNPSREQTKAYGLQLVDALQEQHPELPSYFSKEAEHIDFYVKSDFQMLVLIFLNHESQRKCSYELKLAARVPYAFHALYECSCTLMRACEHPHVFILCTISEAMGAHTQTSMYACAHMLEISWRQHAHSHTHTCIHMHTHKYCTHIGTSTYMHAALYWNTLAEAQREATQWVLDPFS